MRKDFRKIDPDSRGVISPMDFRQILKNYNANLSEEEFFHVISYYDKNRTGAVNYNAFINAFLKEA